VSSNIREAQEVISRHLKRTVSGADSGSSGPNVGTASDLIPSMANCLLRPEEAAVVVVGCDELVGYINDSLLALGLPVSCVW
jgi:hypothetical protein